MNIAYIINNDDFLMSFVSIQSILDNCISQNLKFYLIFEKEFEKDKLSLFQESLNKKKRVDVEYVFYSKEKYLSRFPDIRFNERLFVYEFIKNLNEDKILVLNPYSVIVNDLNELYDLSIDNYSCAISEFVFSGNIKEDFKLSNEHVVNNLVMLINVKYWQNNNYFEKFWSRKTLVKNTPYKYTDFEYFNSLIENYKLVDMSYNYTENWYRDNLQITCSNYSKKTYKNLYLHIEQPKIITYLGPRPIEGSKCKNSYTSLWWEYAERSPIYNEIKEFRRVNKYKLSATSAQNSFKYTWLLSRIWPYIKPYWFRILIGFLIAIPLGLLDGVTAIALKPYMDYVIGGKEFAFAWHGINLNISSMQMAFILPVGVILFAALQGILRYLNGYFSTWTSQRITNDVKFNLFDRLIHMHPQFFDDNSSGIVISRYMGDPGTASAGIVDNIKTITTSLCGALGLIAVMFYSSWKLAFIGVLVLCIAFVPVVLIRRRIKEASNRNMVIGGNITTNINETYSGNKVMAAYELQDRQNKYFKEQTWKSFNINMSLYKRAGWMSPLMYLIASFGIATVLGVGTYLINSGQMTAGAFASFVTSLLLLYKPVKTLGNTLTGIQNIFVAMGRVFELFDLTPAIQDCENPKTLLGLEKGIEFKDVCFEYAPNKPVLKNLNLNVAKNETLAIVGNSGGGKSTLVNLIPRFYDIKSGSIKIDDTDIRDFSLKSLRNNISMVFQDNFLFSGTIKENILMGNPEATTEELMEAIKAAHLQDMIQELPEGLETMLGERGLTLSGGQRQRVAIARAMLRNAPIVILDEATSALDNESEAIVQKAMDNLMKDRTVFIIAHRLSTIKNADRIAVINEGELVELGCHEALMEIENGHYKTLYEMQFKKQEEFKL